LKQQTGGGKIARKKKKKKGKKVGVCSKKTTRVAKTRGETWAKRTAGKIPLKMVVRRWTGVEEGQTRDGKG